jgi:hypothetical protein
MHISRHFPTNLSIILFIVMAFLGGCTDATEGTGLALVNIRLIDAPGDFDEAWIEFEGVELFHGTDRQAVEGQWIHVPYDQVDRQVDVSKLVGEGVLLLGRQEVPVGGIFKIRLLLGSAHYLAKSGKERSLTLLDPEAAVIELDANYRLERNLSYDIYLDFDLEKSIQPTADSTRFTLDPQVRSFVSGDRSIIRGRIQPAAAKPVVYAIHDKDTVTTLSDAQGNYSLRGLDPGKYAIWVLPRKPYRDTTFSVEAEKGADTTLENIVLRLPPSNPK